MITEEEARQLGEIAANGLPWDMNWRLLKSLARLNARTQKTDGCWLWTGSGYPNGYGSIKIAGTRQNILAHHVADLLLNGPLPAGQVRDHTCHDPRACQRGSACPQRRCWNPAHIVRTTQSANTSRARSSRWN